MPVITAPGRPTHELPGTAFTSLATPTTGSTDTAMWRVAISPGTPPTPHQLHDEELFFVLAGTARVRIGDDVARAAAGDVIVVPPHREFELANDGDVTLEAVCCMRAGGRAQLPDGEPFTPPWAR